MKDIIIVGTGKAGFLHYYSYKKFEKIGRVYFVDIDGKIKNENINNERKKDFYIQKQAREIVDEIYKTIQEKRQRESNPISAQSASRLLLTGDAGKYKIAQERFVSGNYMTEAAKHFQFLRQDARNGNRTQDSLEKGLKDSFESKFDSIKEKVTSFFSSGIGRTI